MNQNLKACMVANVFSLLRSLLSWYDKLWRENKLPCKMGMYMHYGFSQKSVLKPNISHLDFEMLRSGWDKGPGKSEPLLAKIRT